MNNDTAAQVLEALAQDRLTWSPYGDKVQGDEYGSGRLAAFHLWWNSGEFVQCVRGPARDLHGIRSYRSRQNAKRFTEQRYRNLLKAERKEKPV